MRCQDIQGAYQKNDQRKISMAKVSFDFDGCLSMERIQRLCQIHVNKGDDVWITTKRFHIITQEFGSNNDLLLIASIFGLINKIQYTNHKPKFTFLKDFDIHYDDDIDEINNLINSGSKCKGVLV